MYQCGYDWWDFRETLHSGPLRTFAENIKIWSESDKNVVRFTWRLTCVFFIVAGDSSYIAIKALFASEIVLG
jgi:hypothetical protein